MGINERDTGKHIRSSVVVPSNETVSVFPSESRSLRNVTIQRNGDFTVGSNDT